MNKNLQLQPKSELVKRFKAKLENFGVASEDVKDLNPHPRTID